MTRFFAPLFALAASTPLVATSPCGYGAACGRPTCDGATINAFQAALPVLNACEEEFAPYRMTWPQDNEAALRAACLGGVCGASFDKLVKWYDIELDVCELNTPMVYSNAIMHISNGYGVICISGSTTVDAFPAVKAELAARIAKARGVKGVMTTPSTTTPAPTTKTPAPSTTAPAPTTSSPTPTPTSTPTKTPAPTSTATPLPAKTASGSETNETDSSTSASKVEEQVVAEPTTTIKPSIVPTPPTGTTPKASPATKTMVSALAFVASVVALAC